MNKWEEMQKKILLMVLIIFLCGILHCATISGFVSRADSGEPIQYVNVYIADTKIGCQTNKKGYYVLNLQQTGDFILTFSLVSYKKETVPITIKNLNDHLVINMQLVKSSVELSPVIVKGTKDESDGPIIQPSTLHQTRQDIQMVVAPMEADVFRAVLAVPGVVPISDFFAGLYVRGGSPDQNLILLDNTEVYNPHHFGGIFSTFNTDAVESIELIKGGYPAKYGGRMSSVLDVTERDGNRKFYEGVGRLSLISASATAEGPWKIDSQSGSFMASFRRTYLEMLKMIISDLPDYYFYDAHIKINWDIDTNNKLSFSGYYGKDVLSYDITPIMDLDWGNSILSAQWMHLFSPQLFSQFIISGSQYNNSIDEVSAEGMNIFQSKNYIRDLTVKGTLNWKPSNHHDIETGIELKFNDTDLKMGTTYQIAQNALPQAAITSLTSSAFTQDTWVINELWTLQPGLRVNWYKTLKEEPAPVPAASYFNLEPRISLKRNLDVGESIYLNFGVYHQYLSLLGLYINSPYDVWLPIDGSVKPGVSHHYILGYNRALSRYFQWDAELYYKTYNHLKEFNTNTFFNWNSETGTLSDAVNTGKGYSYGAELMLRNDWKGLKGYLGYSYSETKRKIDNVNIDPYTGEPQYFYPRYDRTHTVSLVENYNISQNTGWQIGNADMIVGMNFSYNSGQPSEIPERIFFDGENFQLMYSYQDRVRLPEYLRLDLSVHLQWNTFWGSIEPYLEIINVFNHKNVSFRFYDVQMNEDGTLKLVTRDGTQFPFLPFIGVNVRW